MPKIHQKENDPDGKRLFIGIDLGTSSTAIMTNRGHKQSFRSVVGHPIDIIARNMVGKTFLVGDEALESQDCLNLCYPLREGVIDHENPDSIAAAAELLTYAISRANPRPDDELCGIIGIPAQTAPEAIKALQEVIRDELHHAVMVSEPFLVAFGENNKKLMKTSIVVDIGAGTTDICGMKGIAPTPEDQISILNAGDHIDARLKALIEQRYPGVQLTRSLVRKLKEEHAFVGAVKHPVVVELRVAGVPGRFDITREIKTACEGIVPEIVDAVKEVLAGFDLEHQDAALQHIILSGGGSLIKGLDKFIAKELEDYGVVGIIRVLDPFFAGCNGALRLASFIPVQEWHRVGMTVGG